MALVQEDNIPWLAEDNIHGAFPKESNDIKIVNSARIGESCYSGQGLHLRKARAQQKNSCVHFRFLL